MRRDHFNFDNRPIYFFVTVLLVLAAAGCNMFDAFRQPRASHVRVPQESTATDPVMDQVQAYTDKVNQSELEPLRNNPMRVPPQVHWLDMGGVSGRAVSQADDRAIELPSVTKPEARQPEKSITKAAFQKTEELGSGGQQNSEKLMNRSELIRALAREIRRSDDQILRKAQQHFALNLIDPSYPVENELLDKLDDNEKRRLRKYHEVITMLNNRVIFGDGGRDGVGVRDQLDQELDDLFGQMPIRIQNVQLCRRTFGYGIYEPFDSYTFLSGNDNRSIVYVELDHFCTVKRSDERFEVKLQQELTLFNESDGLAVWRHEPVEIVDISRNRRHDFFMNQRITLPARLSVGKYLLKVSVTDMHGGSIDETTVGIEIVADQALVSK